MRKGHFKSAGASIDHGAASMLFPTADLDAKVLQHRDAELVLGDTESADVIVITPTSMASSYFLTQHPLTAIPVNELSDSVRSQLSETLDAPLDSFEFIQIGKWITDSPNRSLNEYAKS